METKKKVKDLLPYVVLGLVYLLNIFMILRCSSTYLNSDMSSEMLLAKLMNDHGDLFFCKEWNYSTEIRFIYLQIFYRIGLFVFPNNWIYARALGTGIALLIMMLSFLHLTKTLDLGKIGVWMSVLFMCPISIIYFQIVGFGNSYVPHLICYLLITDLIIMYIKNKKPIHLITIILFGIIGGMNGVRIIFSYFLPVLSITIICAYAFNNKLNVKDWFVKSFKEYYVVLVSLISIGVGFLINEFYLSKIYKFSDYLGRELYNLSLNEILNRLSDFLMIFGYHGGNKLFSYATISSAFCILFDVILIYVLVNGVRNIKEMIKNNNKIYFVFIIGLIISIFEFAFVFNITEQTPINYWIPLVPYCFLAIGMYLKYSKKEKSWKRLLLVLTIISIFGTSLYPIAYVANTKNNNSKMEIVDYLLKNDLTQGYGSFWSCNVLTELSNGKIDMWSFGDGFDLTANYHVAEWLQETRHVEEEPKGKTFLILNSEKDEIDTSGIQDKKKLETGTFTIYVFDTFYDLKQFMNNR